MTKRNLSRKDRQDIYSWVSKYLADVSKLIIAGVVLAALMQQEIASWWLVLGGTVAASGFFWMAYKALLKSKR